MNNTSIFKNIILPIKLATYLPWSSQLYLTNKTLYRFRDIHYDTNLETEIFKIIYPELKYELLCEYFSFSFNNVYLPYLDLDNASIKIDLLDYPFHPPGGMRGMRGPKGVRGVMGCSGDEKDGDEMIDHRGVKFTFINGIWTIEEGRCDQCTKFLNLCWCQYDQDLCLIKGNLGPKEYFSHQIYKYSAESFLQKLKNLNINISDASPGGCFGPM